MSRKVTQNQVKCLSELLAVGDIMLQGVISSKTKINILVKLFLNPDTKSYLRELASEFQVSTNAVRSELLILQKNKLLLSERSGRHVYYRANPEHPLFPELSSIVRKITGIDSLLSSIVERLGNLEAVYVTGDYACGRDTGVIDILLIGDINAVQLQDILRKTEKYINRKIRSLVLSRSEFRKMKPTGTLNPAMCLWKRSSQKEKNI